MSRLSEGQVRDLMGVGHQAAKVIRFTGDRILALGAFADEEKLDPQMILVWAQALQLAASWLREEGLRRGGAEP